LSKQIKLDNLKSLNAIHSIAKKYEIVSPYSSMLVLVNDEQRRLLKEAEAASDHFDRKIEDGKETLTKPNNPLKTSVPEPSGGWILAIGAAAIFILKRRKIRAYGMGHWVDKVEFICPESCPLASLCPLFQYGLKILN
jgi:putative PEP-CTERM system integral membrane protein